MGYYEKLASIGKLKEALMDEESRVLFDARVDYMISRDEDQFFNVVDTLNKNWYCEELNKILEKVNVEGIMVFGSGRDGRRVKKILELCNYPPCCFCDSDGGKVGKVVDGLPVISVDNLLKEFRNYLVIFGSRRYADEMDQTLAARGFPNENILNSIYKMIIAQWGKQYFDIFSPEKDEVFVDGGGYNGDTIMDFLAWTGQIYKQIYIFEPLDEMFKIIQERVAKEHIRGSKLYQNALWNKREKLSFFESGSGSRVMESGKKDIMGVSLDEIVGDEKVTYIKMDVEGSELMALEGARNTIIRNKPRLAICIYHKPEDIIELPTYILEIVPEYKFFIRHYCSNMWETVLYATV